MSLRTPKWSNETVESTRPRSDCHTLKNSIRRALRFEPSIRFLIDSAFSPGLNIRAKFPIWQCFPRLAAQCDTPEQNCFSWAQRHPVQTLLLVAPCRSIYTSLALTIALTSRSRAEGLLRAASGYKILDKIIVVAVQELPSRRPSALSDKWEDSDGIELLPNTWRVPRRGPNRGGNREGLPQDVEALSPGLLRRSCQCGHVQSSDKGTCRTARGATSAQGEPARTNCNAPTCELR